MRNKLTSLLAMALGTASATQPTNWVVTQHEYKKFPLFTRYPDNLDYDKLQQLFPISIVVTIALSELTDNGLPAANYNTSLELFDNFVVEYFTVTSNGQCVLVETFGGKRHFYIYVSDSVDIAVFENAVKHKFPQHAVSFETDRDPGWLFIRRYAKEYMGGS